MAVRRQCVGQEEVSESCRWSEVLVFWMALHSRKVRAAEEAQQREAQSNVGDHSCKSGTQQRGDHSHAFLPWDHSPTPGMWHPA